MPLLQQDLGYTTVRPEVVKASLSVALGEGTHLVLVAEDAAGIQGFAHASEYHFLGFEKVVNVMGLAVRDGNRGKGIGKALLAGLEVWARQMGAAGVRLNSGVEREEAHRFYSAMGYQSPKEQKKFVKMF